MKFDHALPPARLARDPRIASRELSVERVHDIAGTRRLAELRPGNTRFVQLAELLDTRSRHRLLREAVEAGIRVLLVESATQEEAQALEAQFPVLASRLDLDRDQGSGLYGLQLAKILEVELAREPRVTEAFAGMSDLRADSEALRLLEAVPTLRRSGPARRLMSNPKTLVYAVVFAYSSLRALAVTYVPEFHGSLVVLWLIDILTAIPYTWGVLTMLFSPRLAVRITATAVTLATFTAPYIYFWTQGSNYPAYVWVIIGALTLLSVLIEAGKFVQERFLQYLYRQITPSEPRQEPLVAASAFVPVR